MLTQSLVPSKFPDLVYDLFANLKLSKIYGGNLILGSINTLGGPFGFGTISNGQVVQLSFK